VAHAILATQEAEIRRIVVRSQLGKETLFYETLSQKTLHKNRLVSQKKKKKKRRMKFHRCQKMGGTRDHYVKQYKPD
jgi:hypothetical protein